MSKSASGSTKCGWCMTGHHKQCKPETKYYEKVWQCDCKICHIGVVSEESSEQEEEQND